MQHKQDLIHHLKKQQEAYKKALAAKLSEAKAEYENLRSEYEAQLKKEKLLEIQEHLRAHEDQHQQRVQQALAAQAEDIREER